MVQSDADDLESRLVGAVGELEDKVSNASEKEESPASVSVRNPNNRRIYKRQLMGDSKKENGE